MATKRELIARFIADNPTASSQEISAATGANLREVQRVTKKLKATPAALKQGVSFECNGAQGVASSLSTRITSLDQLLSAAKVDLGIWEVDRHVINKWEVAMKEENAKGKVSAVVEPLWQIKIWLKRRSPAEIGLSAALTEQIAEAKKTPLRLPPVRYASSKGDCLAELDIFDLHYGKLCWAAECGEDMDVKIAERDFREAVARLRDAAKPYGITKFLFPIGNDYLNVDNEARTTFAGTPQDEDGRWQRTFVNGRKLLAWAIRYLREVAPVDVLVVRGNHDWQRTFYLGDSLECLFSETKEVSIDNTPTGRKYYTFGNVLLGFTHSDKELVKDLPLTMAVEVPEKWAAAKYREFHCGHLHHKRVRDFQPVLEHKSITVRHLSSLTAADAWHAGKGYRSQRAAQCFIWHKNRGCLAELAFNL